MFTDLYSACLVMSIICDMVISLSMVYFLNKLRSGFRSLNSRVKSREMLQDSYEISFNDLRATEGHDTEPVAEIVLAKLDGA
ncbi:hypothetical protein DXG01_012435 [Tephrocybe rancida]|nr:hypothetical protein DXG01_012435 [Tephrocybe rancida]